MWSKTIDTLSFYRAQAEALSDWTAASSHADNIVLLHNGIARYNNRHLGRLDSIGHSASMDFGALCTSPKLDSAIVDDLHQADQMLRSLTTTTLDSYSRRASLDVALQRPPELQRSTRSGSLNSNFPYLSTPATFNIGHSSPFAPFGGKARGSDSLFSSSQSSSSTSSSAVFPPQPEFDIGPETIRPGSTGLTPFMLEPYIGNAADPSCGDYFNLPGSLQSEANISNDALEFVTKGLFADNASEQGSIDLPVQA